MNERETGWEDDEEDVSSYWKIKEKRECVGVWKKKHYIALSGELVLEEAMDLLQGRLYKWINTGI
jgi:hypothetical protein